MTRPPELSFFPRAIVPLVVLGIVATGLWSEGGIAAADPGDATAESDLVVIQKNIQNIGGNQYTRENSSQTATNLVLSSQDSAAQAGIASASDGGHAASGDATARNSARVVQMNHQVIAGKNCSVDQIATNIAIVDQSATAISGAATASGDGSNASSGDAKAKNHGVIMQKNKQKYVCKGGDGGGGQQIAVNVGTISQSAVATSGNAAAGEGETGSSGDATVVNRARLEQNNTQRVID